MRRFVLRAIILALVLSFLTGAAPYRPPADGTIESLTLIYDSGHSEYYELVYWSDGLRINGYLGKPKGDGPFPAVIYNRGGVWDAGKLVGVELIPLVECGFVAAATQYRGNGGSEGRDEFGGGDLNDVLNLLPVLRQTSGVDTNRIGMMGGSRGGMMTYLALKWQSQKGRNDIKAAVSIAGIADLYMWLDEHPDLLNSVFVPILGYTPDQAPNLYQRRSATYWPRLINAPLLIVHGDADTTVSLEESRKLYDLLKDRGKTVELTVIPGGDHALAAFWGGMPEAVGWFERYLSAEGEDHSFWGHVNDLNAVSTWMYVNYVWPRQG